MINDFIKITSVIIPLMTITILLSTLFGPISQKWISICSYPCNLTALFGLSETLALNMLITSSEKKIKYFFGAEVFLLLILAIATITIKLVFFVNVMYLILLLVSEKISKCNNPLFKLFIIALIIQTILGQGIILVQSNSFDYGITVTLVLLTFIFFFGAAFILSKCRTIFSTLKFI